MQILRRLAAPLLSAALLLSAAPGHALDQAIFGGLEIGADGGLVWDPNPDVPPIDPPPPALALLRTHHDALELVVRTQAGLGHLYRSTNAVDYEHVAAFAANSEVEYLDAGLGVGVRYCYRLDRMDGTITHQTFLCASTDWRVGFTERLFTPQATERVVELFDWRDTQPLLTGTAEAPALYYMNVWVDDPEMPEGLRGIGLHVQETPIFGEELPGFAASQTLIRQGDVVTGRWYFAVVPGHFYNQIRERARAQIGAGDEPGIRALVFRELPVWAAREFPLDRHRLSHRYLGERGFEFNGEVVSACVFDEELGGEICPYFLGWAARKLAGWVEEGAESLVEGIRSAIGHFQLLYEDDVDFRARFRVLNTDSTFGTERYMVSGWNGEVLVLKNVRVHVRQGVAAFYGHTDMTGSFHKTVLAGVDTQVCVETENHVAELTEFLTEEVVCLPGIGSLQGDVSRDFDVRDPYLNVLAAMTDASEYVETVWGHDMPKITVLVGDMADTVAIMGRSFAPCMGRVPGAIGIAADVLAGAIHPALLLVSGFAEFQYAVDIVLRTDSDASRGVAVHEFGHAVMCSLLGSQGPDAFALAWTDVIFATSDQSAENDTSYLNEAFADFLTSQVVGGTNYFAPDRDFVSSQSVNYCEAGSDCVEDNFDSRATFSSQVARVVALLHDAFDAAGDPNDGSDWANDGLGTLQPARFADSIFADEAIELAPSDLPAIFARWDERGTLLNEDNFLGGLADLLRARGYGDAAVCALFALHDAGTSCPGFVLSSPWLGWADALTSPDLLFALDGSGPTTTVPGVDLALPTTWLTVASSTSEAVAGAGAPTPTIPESADEPIVVLEGTQKTKVRGLGKVKLPSAFAFRLGDGWFDGLGPDGGRFAGGWSARARGGQKLRLHTAPEFEDAIERMLRAGLDADGLELPALDGPLRIELKVRGDGSVVGKIRATFLVPDGERTRRGSYVAKLRGEVF